MPLGWTNTPMLYPPLLYQNQVEANRFPFTHHGSAGSFTIEDSHVSEGPSNMSRTKNSYFSGCPNNVQGDHNDSSRFAGWRPAESPLGSTLTEDELLEMVLYVYTYIFLIRLYFLPQIY